MSRERRVGSDNGSALPQEARDGGEAYARPGTRCWRSGRAGGR